VSRCFRKTMVALKDIRNYTGSDRSSTSSLRHDCEFMFLGSSALKSYNRVSKLRE